jgi:hypothetical protein
MRKRKREPSGWGAWLAGRARHVGYAYFRDLARDVGCRQEQISRWIGADAPPAMRKRFAAALAAALRTDLHTLFVTFAEVRPEAAPLADPVARAPDAESIRRKVQAIVELLDADGLRELQERGHELLKRELAGAAA